MNQKNLNQHISDLTNQNKVVGSVSYRISVHHFQVFIENCFNEARDKNEETFFLDELFVAISLQQQTALNHVILLDALINVDLGNKVAKANKMAKDIINIPPETCADFWNILSRVLPWLEKSLRSSIQLILHPLREIMWKWCSSRESDKIVAGLKLMKLFLKHFPVHLEEHFIHVQSSITQFMDHPLLEIRISAKEALICAITTQETLNYFGVVTMCARLNFILSENNWRSYESALEGADIIVSHIPDMISCFTFNELPIALLNDRDQDAQLAAIRVVLFALRTTPALYNEELSLIILDGLKSLISKRSSIRKTALLSLGNYLFYRKNPISENEQKIINKCRSLIIDSYDIDQSSFALIALLLITQDNMMKDLSLIFSKPISEFAIEGFKHFLKIYPDKKGLVSKYIVSQGASAITQSNNWQQICLTCQSFTLLEIPSSFFSLPFLFQVSIYLNHTELCVRKAVSSFLLYVYSQNPSTELSQILYTTLCTETDDSHQLEIMSKLSKERFRVESLPILQTFLYDVNNRVRNESLKIVTENSSIDTVGVILNSFLNEKIGLLRTTQELSKDNIECFLIVTQSIFSENGQYAKHFLSPFVDILLNALINFPKKLPKSALLLLSYLIRISPEHVDISKLVSQMSYSLGIHSSKARVDAALDLLLSALDSSIIRQALYKEHFSIVYKVLLHGNKPEQQVSRSKLLKALCSIGAIDPKLIPLCNQRSADPDTRKLIDTPNYFIYKSESNDPCVSLIYSSVGVAISHIMGILFDESLLTLHPPAIEALLAVLKTYRQIGQDLEKLVVKHLNHLLSKGDPSTVSLLLTNITTLIAVLGDHFEPLIPHVIEFICQKWEKLDKFQMIRITEWLFTSVPDALVEFMPRLANLFLKGIERYPERIVDAVFSVFVSFRDKVKSISHIIYPVLLSWILNNSSKTQICLEVLEKLKQIFLFAGTDKFLSQIVRTLIIVGQTNKVFHDKIMEVLLVTAAQIGKPFLFYVPKLVLVFEINSHPMLSQAIQCIESDLPFSGDVVSLVRPDNKGKKSKTHPKEFSAPSITRPTKDFYIIKQPTVEWDEGQWLFWNDETFSALVRNSVSRAISACRPLAERHSKLRETIYPLAFVLYYIHVIDIIPEKLYSLFDVVFHAPNIPRSILMCFLSSIELIEVLGMQLPVKHSLISNCAMKFGVLYLSLRASEAIFDKGETEIIERLITLNQSLGLPLAANGILRQSQIRGYPIKQDLMAEKLGLWEDSMRILDKLLMASPQNEKLIIRKLNCLCELSRYDEIPPLLSNTNNLYQASVDFHTFSYSSFIENASKLKDLSNEALFYRIVGHVLVDEISHADDLIYTLRGRYIADVFPAIGDDYELVIQSLSEAASLYQIEELMRFRKMSKLLNSPTPSERNYAKNVINSIISTWKTRFTILPQIPKVLHSFLSLANIVVPPSQLEAEWQLFIQSSISHRLYLLASSTIRFLINNHHDSLSIAFLNEIQYDQCVLNWHENRNIESINELILLVNSISPSEKLFEIATCSAAAWYSEKQMLTESKNVLSGMINQTNVSPNAWEQWSRINFALYKKSKDTAYLFETLNGAFSGLMISTDSTLSLSLIALSSLLTNNDSFVRKLFESKYKCVPVHYWIEVLPQIVARLTSDDNELQILLFNLLAHVGDAHPHPVLYSLLVSYRGDNIEKRRISNDLFNQLCLKYSEIVAGTVTLTTEFIRIAVSWWEICYVQLDSASRSFFPSLYEKEMLLSLDYIHKVVNSEPETLNEITFISQFGQKLSLADSLIQRYKVSKDKGDLNQAWNLFTEVYNRLRTIVPEMMVLPLNEISPILSSMKSLSLLVPGTYSANSKLIYISHFRQKVKVIKSKQRPRKMTVCGSNGETFTFLLKAHEDTRLDERVMQIFGYINSILGKSSLPLKSKLSIAQYKVIPLTMEVGLIEWVSDCSTLYDVIKEYRNHKGIEIQTEYQTTQRLSPNYDSLPIEEKVLAFKKGLLSTTGDDIKQLLLSCAYDSSHWLQRRTSYTTSMAMMSMVGYILGLGDRHLSNIMMKNWSAKLVHIDFGDCFEVAMHRDHYPEMVPFRLTRLMENALEVTGIEGTFRKCCENVIQLMRENDEQILGLLETFIYDPLFQWTDKSTKKGRCSAVTSVQRILDKLTGRDFSIEEELSIEDQVDKLIIQAKDPKNLCVMYHGWFPWW